MRSFRLFFLAMVALCAVTACSAPTVVLKGERFTVEIADEPQEQALGLMFRTELAADHGMLFIFPDERPRSFWMKNCKIPLDILYFDSDQQLINAHHSVPPCKTSRCPGYASARPARYVLELRAGTANRLEVQPGERLQMSLR